MFWTKRLVRNTLFPIYLVFFQIICTVTLTTKIVYYDTSAESWWFPINAVIHRNRERSICTCITYTIFCNSVWEACTQHTFKAIGNLPFSEHFSVRKVQTSRTVLQKFIFSHSLLGISTGTFRNTNCSFIQLQFRKFMLFNYFLKLLNYN